MLVIRGDLVDAMVAHARADHPDEACGVIAGPEGSDRPERFIQMQNAERSPTFYRFDSSEQLRVWKAMDEADEVPVVIYHSHTAHRGLPEPHRRLDRRGTRRALRLGVHPRSRRARAAQLSHRRRRRHRRTRQDRRAVLRPRTERARPCQSPFRSRPSCARTPAARSASPPTAPRSQAVITDLENNYSGITERIVDGEKLHRFVNVYVNDEDVRFSGGLATEISDGDSVTILPAVAGG